MSNKTSTAKITFSIGFKLVAIITILLLVSLGVITFLVSVMVSGDVRVTAEDNNFSVNKRSATEVENTLSVLRSASFGLLDTLDAAVAAGAGIEREVLDSFFNRNADVAALALATEEGGASGTRERFFTNRSFFLSNKLDPALPELFLAASPEALERALAGEMVLKNALSSFGIPVLALLMPRGENGRGEGRGEAVTLFFSPESLSQSFGTGANISYMVNDEGELLLHGNYETVLTGANLAEDPFVKILWESPEQNFQTLYTGADGNRYFGAFQKLSLLNAAVLTDVEYDLVFEGVAATTRRNILLTIIVLLAATLFIWFFSKTISSPLKKLAAAAGRIEEGQFEIELAAKSRDEVGVLAQSFVSMGRGLAERERLRDAFGRFINKEIAEQAMKGELALGGETKKVTIFFSDIRNFTAMSEKLKPAEVVEFLNGYMTAMVDCVNKTGGVVDKFIGDAVMAVWGAPVSRGSPAEDALNCVRSALMMRTALEEFNKDHSEPARNGPGRNGEKKPLIRIGCGINTGDVVAGQIGSRERMEYTVIGDAVNLASRTEALNKPLKTDILITENTQALIRDHIITEEMPAVTVKGKEKPVRLFAVINLREPGAEQPGPTTLGGLRKMLGLEAPDMNKVDINAGEEKYHIE
jgi:adenylate cyclase